LAALVHRCMEKSAADRPQTAQDIVNALDGLVTPVGTVPSIQRNAGAHPSTRARSARVAATALGAVVIISGAWYATRNARTVEVSARRVAVVPFENLTGDTNLTVIGRVASRELSRSIELTDSADVVAASVAELAADGGRGGEAAVVERVARATGAAMIVVGSYTKSGDSLRMVASLVDARTGKHVGGLDPSTGPLNEPMVAIEGLRERLLGSMVSGDLARKAAVAARAPKFSAYVEFLDGVREFSRDQPASRPYFERAIAIDPGFVDAHIYLATTYRNARLYDSAQRVIQQLNKQREHFSSTDRAAAQYGTASLYGDAAEALRLSRELARRTSDPLWSYLSGYWSLAMVRADTAAEAFLRSDSAMVTAGWAPYIFQAAWAQHLLGHYQKEMALLDHGIVRLPRSAEGYTGTRLRPLAGLRNLPAARALADTILKRSEPGTPTGLLSVLAAAREFDVHGDTAGAHILNRAAIDWARSNAPRVRSLPWEQAVGCMWLFAGALDSAAVHFARAVPDTSAERVGTVAYLAMIAARRGNSARARTVSDSLAANVRTWDRGRTPFWRAAIASELGERAQAVRLLTVAAKQGVLMWTWHSELALRALHGFPPYEVLIKPRS
jgi:TolB-like protein/tetratricopeptide (TPR) repeat protein